MPSIEADVLVLGAGPAGTAAALTLVQRDARVALVDSGHRAPRLGEALPPGAVTHLAALGIDAGELAACHLPVWRYCSAWGTDRLDQLDLTFHPYGNAWRLDREAFDSRLRYAAVQNGAVILDDTRIHVERDSRGWTAMLGDQKRVTARFVIDATGRSSAFARSQGARRHRRDRLVGLIVELADAGVLGAEDALLVESTPNGWWYSAHLPKLGRIAIMFTDADLVPSNPKMRIAFLRRNWNATRFTRVNADLRERSVPKTRLADTSSLDSVVGTDWIAAGDAAAAFDPLSSLGLASALESGRLAAIASEASMLGNSEIPAAYERFIHGQMDAADRLRRSYYGMETRWPGALFWSRRHQPVNGRFAEDEKPVSQFGNEYVNSGPSEFR